MAFRLAMLILIAAGLANGLPVAAAPGPKPIVTNKTRFRIPFRFDAAALQRMDARELRLYVSTDGGANWELTQSTGAEAGKFEFQAPTDGEYRFSVTSNGSAQMFVDGREILSFLPPDPNAPDAETPVYAQASVYLPQGWRDIEIRYSPAVDQPFLRILWQPPGSAAVQ